MKKTILTAAIVAAAAYAADGQVRVGLKAGLNAYNFSGNDAASEFETKLSFHAGGIVNFPVAKNFSVQSEVVLSGEGTKISEGQFTARYNFNYVNIPILAQFNSSSGFYAEAGPQIGFLASGKYKEDDGEEEYEVDIKNSFNSVNFSAAIGAGYRHSSGFGAGVRYNLGLVNIYDYEEGDLKSGGFQVGVSYLFGVNGGEAKKTVAKTY